VLWLRAVCAALSVYTEPYSAMLENLEYGIVVAVASCLGACARRCARIFRLHCVRGLLVLQPAASRGHAQSRACLAGTTIRNQKKNSAARLRSPGLAARRVLPHDALHGRNTRDWIRTEGLEHFVAAQARGKGVLVLTVIWARGNFRVSITR